MGTTKTCPDCGRPLAILLQWDYYCPNCDELERPYDPWDIDFKSNVDCDCEPKYHYIHAGKVWCRACGDCMRELGKN